MSTSAGGITPLDRWFRSAATRLGRPWLILGKGPSAAGFSPGQTDDRNVVALNQAMAGQSILLGHVVDIEVLESLSESDLAGVRFLCMPWVPHVRKEYMVGRRVFFGPGSLSLAQWCQRFPLLSRFANEGRLLSYNLVTSVAVEHNPDLPDIPQKTFSGSLVAALLIRMGVREVRTLGIDGGLCYAPTFRSLESRSELPTGQSGYDAQFQEIADLLVGSSVSFGPEAAGVPARIFVGCMPEQELAFQVLSWSIKKHASLSTEVARLHEAIASARIDIPIPSDEKNRGRTPFSFQRFAIPEICSFDGRAIYLDSDMLVLRDIRELWLRDMGGAQVLSAASSPDSSRSPQFSVMLMDCAALRWSLRDIVDKLDRGQLDYEGLMYRMETVKSWRQSIPSTWNSLEIYQPQVTGLLHFTDMNRQPWLDPLHPHGRIWGEYLLDGISRGFIPRTLVKTEVDVGNVRPSVLLQIDRGEPDPRRLPFAAIRRDLGSFLPPHLRGRPLPSRLRYECDKAARAIFALGREKIYAPAISTGKRGARRMSYLFMR